MSLIQNDHTRDNTMRRFQTTSDVSSNQLLASLPAHEYERLAPHLQRVPMKTRQVVHHQGRPVGSIYFPGGGECSLVKTTEAGETIQIAAVGSEGVIGGTPLFPHDELPYDVIVHIAGPYADVLPCDVFTAEVDRHGSLYDSLIRYNQAFMTQVMQGTVCNGLHSAKARVCRTLLSAHDHAESDQFGFTHETMATFLGVRRPTVTLVIGELHADGIIEAHRGSIRILNRPQLEAASCECHRIIQRTFGQLLPELAQSSAS